MKIVNTTPAQDGFHMPAEFEPHTGTLLIWPVRPGSWPYGGQEAQEIFTTLAKELSKGETVYVLCDQAHAGQVREKMQGIAQVLCIETDDAWARDVGPTFVVKGSGKEKEVRGVDWKFNAWGGDFDGLYAHWEKDDAAANAFCEAIQKDIYDAHPFVLEGGSIHVDGEGTVLATEACLLSLGRNPLLCKAELEEKLCAYLGAEKVIWIPRGIYQDETNEHVDNVCAFTAPGEVVLAWTDNPEDPQYALSHASYEALLQQTDAKGRKLKIHKMLIPDEPVCITEEDLQGYVFEEGEDTREIGERLAASYVNFYIGTECVLVPQFGDVRDADAISLLQSLFPNKRVVGIPARAIIVGGGNIHCVTQQIP